MCIPPPGAAREPRRRERGSAGPRAGGEGGPGVTAAEQEKSAFPISSPRFFTHPSVPSLPLSSSEALGCESPFLASQQNGAGVDRGAGREAPGTARSRLHFRPAGSLPSTASTRGRGRGRGRARDSAGRPASWASSSAWATAPARTRSPAAGEALPRTRGPEPGRASPPRLLGRAGPPEAGVSRRAGRRRTEADGGF